MLDILDLKIANSQCQCNVCIHNITVGHRHQDKLDVADKHTDMLILTFYVNSTKSRHRNTVTIVLTVR